MRKRHKSKHSETKKVKVRKKSFSKTSRTLQTKTRNLKPNRTFQPKPNRPKRTKSKTPQSTKRAVSTRKSKSLGEMLEQNELKHLEKYINLVNKNIDEKNWLTNEISKGTSRPGSCANGSAEKRPMRHGHKSPDAEVKAEQFESNPRCPSLLDRTDSRADSRNLVTFDLGSKLSISKLTSVIGSRGWALSRLKAFEREHEASSIFESQFDSVQKGRDMTRWVWQGNWQAPFTQTWSWSS